MTLREFREKTRDLDENLILMSLYDEYGNYNFIDHVSEQIYIISKNEDDDFETATDKINENFEEEYDVSMEDLETTKVILLS